jgi:hypothetical protein
LLAPGLTQPFSGSLLFSPRSARCPSLLLSHSTPTFPPSRLTQELASRRQPHLVDVQQQLPRDPQPVVDSEGAVHLGVVDETLPADGRPGLLKVDTHEDVQVGLGLFGVGSEVGGVFKGGVNVVDGAGTAHIKKEMMRVSGRVRSRKVKGGEGESKEEAEEDEEGLTRR